MAAIAVAQLSPGTDKPENLRAMARYATRAAEAGAELLVAPEYSMFTADALDARAVAAAEPIDGEWVSGLAELAQRNGLAITAGIIEATATGDRIFNTLVTFGSTGELLALYRKVHLFDAFGFQESSIVTPGPLAEPAVFPLGDLQIGLQTCYDLRFPEITRRLIDAGANTIVVPAQWIPGPRKVEQWTALVTARAIENTAYVVAAGQSAPTGSGHSIVVDPAGIPLASLDREPDLMSVSLSASQVESVRMENPSLRARRFSVVPTIVAPNPNSPLI